MSFAVGLMRELGRGINERSADRKDTIKQGLKDARTLGLPKYQKMQQNKKTYATYIKQLKGFFGSDISDTEYLALAAGKGGTDIESILKAVTESYKGTNTRLTADNLRSMVDLNGYIHRDKPIDLDKGLSQLAGTYFQVAAKDKEKPSDKSFLKNLLSAGLIANPQQDANAYFEKAEYMGMPVQQLMSAIGFTGKGEIEGFESITTGKGIEAIQPKPSNKTYINDGRAMFGASLVSKIGTFNNVSATLNAKSGVADLDNTVLKLSGSALTAAKSQINLEAGNSYGLAGRAYYQLLNNGLDTYEADKQIKELITNATSSEDMTAKLNMIITGGELNNNKEGTGIVEITETDIPPVVDSTSTEEEVTDDLTKTTVSPVVSDTGEQTSGLLTTKSVDSITGGGNLIPNMLKTTKEDEEEVSESFTFTAPTSSVDKSIVSEELLKEPLIPVQSTKKSLRKNISNTEEAVSYFNTLKNYTGSKITQLLSTIEEAKASEKTTPKLITDVVDLTKVVADELDIPEYRDSSFTQKLIAKTNKVVDILTDSNRHAILLRNSPVISKANDDYNSIVEYSTSLVEAIKTPTISAINKIDSAYDNVLEMAKVKIVDMENTINTAVNRELKEAGENIELELGMARNSKEGKAIEKALSKIGKVIMPLYSPSKFSGDVSNKIEYVANLDIALIEDKINAAVNKELQEAGQNIKEESSEFFKPTVDRLTPYITSVIKATSDVAKAILPMYSSSGFDKALDADITNLSKVEDKINDAVNRELKEAGENIRLELGMARDSAAFKSIENAFQQSIKTLKALYTPFTESTDAVATTARAMLPIGNPSQIFPALTDAIVNRIKNNKKANAARIVRNSIKEVEAELLGNNRPSGLMTPTSTILSSFDSPRYGSGDNVVPPKPELPSFSSLFKGTTSKEEQNRIAEARDAWDKKYGDDYNRDGSKK